MKQTQLHHFGELPDTARFDAPEHWVIVIREQQAKQEWPAFPYRDTLQKRYKRLHRDAEDSPPLLLTDLPNDNAARVALATAKPGLSTFELLSLARKLVDGHQDFQPTELGIAVIGFSAKKSARVAEALLAATLAADAEMPDYHNKRKNRTRLEQVHLYGVPDKYSFERTFAEDEGNALARYLTALPQNELTPTLYRKRIARLAGEFGWKSQFLGHSPTGEEKGRRLPGRRPGQPAKRRRHSAPALRA